MATSPSNPRRFVGIVGLAIFVALHLFGLYGYFARQVLTPAWLWENQDYMLYLWPAYYHLHVALMIGHLYVWGPLLILRRFRRAGWSLYWVSFIAAYALTTYPLMTVQRFAQLHGAGAYVAVQVYAVLLAVLFVDQFFRTTRQGVIALHLFSGFPIVLLGLHGQTTLGISNILVVWALLALHIIAAGYLRLGQPMPLAATPAYAPSRLAA
jgi:hypothetical protein